MSNIINKIRISGTDYTLSATTSGGVTSGEVETMISAATSGYTARFAEDEEVTAAALNDLNERISGISGNNVVELTQAQYDALVSGGTVDPTAFYIITDATPIDISNYWTSAQTNSAINAAVSGKQDTLSAGTNITISGNVISAEGGKAVSGGTNISITTGETADTINCTLPISYGGQWGHSINLGRSDNKLTSGDYNVVQGIGTEVKNNREMSCCSWNVSRKATSTFGDSGNTLFSVGNGTADNTRHNAFEIRQNGDIYLSLNGQDVKLQDQLGGGGTVDQTIISGSTNAVAGGAVYDKFDEVEQVTAAGLNAVNDKFDGLKLKKLTQAEYNALVTKDASTLYVIVN